MYRFALESLFKYYYTTYVNGTIRHIPRPKEAGGVKLHLPGMSPLFPPSLWNVREATTSDTDRANNFCESWKHAFMYLVGNIHPSVWVVIQACLASTHLCGWSYRPVLHPPICVGGHTGLPCIHPSVWVVIQACLASTHQCGWSYRPALHPPISVGGHTDLPCIHPSVWVVIQTCLAARSIDVFVENASKSTWKRFG